MRPAHDTGPSSARKRARRFGRRLGLAAALLACGMQAATLQWGRASLFDPSPDAPWPLRSMLSVARWPGGPLPPDKYPEAWHLLAGSAERIAAAVVLDADERASVERLSDHLSQALAAHAGDATFDPTRALLDAAVGMEPVLWRLVLAGRIAALLMSFLLSLAATEVAMAIASPRFGWIAGAAIGLMPAVVHYGAALNTDVPALAWCALAWALAVDAAHGARTVPFALCGAAMGLAAATKDQAVATLPGILWFALRRLRDDAVPRLRRLLAIAAGAAASYALTSGLLQGTWREHVEFVLGRGSQPYREFPFTTSGVLALLKATGDRFLVAGGLVGAVGIVLLVVTAAMRGRGRALAVLLPAIGCVAFFLVPAGYVYPRFTLPLCLCGAIAMAWALSHSAGAAGERRRRVWIGGLVALWSLGEASGLVEAKWSDPRPPSVAALAARRTPADEVWICAQPWFFAPFPAIEPPRRFLTLQEVAVALKRGDVPPRFLWLAVERHAALAGKDALEQMGATIGMKLVERFESDSRAALATEPDGLMLPVIALFEAKSR
jgi:hypothetical protein